MPDLRDIFSFPITEPFGVIGPFGGPPHTGVDLGLNAGTPVPAEGAGTVESVFQDTVGGEQVKIKYASGAEGWFAHLMAIFVQPGQQVGPQTEIGLSGATGHVTGPHLHFEERDPAGNLIDPMTDVARSYLGPAPTVANNDCPKGWHRGFNVLGLEGFCVPDNPRIPTIAGPGAQKNVPTIQQIVTDPVGKAIGQLSDQIASGARTFAVAGVVIGAVILLGYGGLKRALD